MRDFLQFSHFVAVKSTFSYEFSLEPENLQPQNRCFVRGFRQFSPHRTKCHACHGICTLSPLDAALPMQFAKNTQHDTSKVLRLPRKMTMDFAKVLRLPRKLQHIFWKRRKSIAPATQNDFRHVAEHVWMSRSATPARRLRSRTQRWANTPSTPRPPEWNGNPCYAFGKDTSITCLKTVTCLQRQIFNNIAINLHACISTTSVHVTFACISLTNIRNV